MPLPARLESLVRTRAFWDRFSNPGLEPLEDCSIRFLIDQRHALRLELTVNMWIATLYVEKDGTSGLLGFSDCAHPVPHALSWAEVDRLCQAIAISDQAFPHPGISLLFLYRFAVMKVDEAADRYLSLLQQAYRDLYPEDAVRSLLSEADTRCGKVRWVNGAGREWPVQDDDNLDFYLCSFRHPDIEEFPFGALASALEAAANVINGSTMPAQNPDHPASLS